MSPALAIALASVLTLLVTTLLGWELLEAVSLAVGLHLSLSVLASLFTSCTIHVPWMHAGQAAVKGAEIALVVLASLTLVEMMRNDGVLESLLTALEPDHRHRDRYLLGVSIVGAGALESVASFGTPATLVGPLLVDAGVRKPLAAAAALIGHAPFGAFAAFGVPVLVAAEVTRRDPGDLTAGALLWELPALALLPVIVGRAVDVRHGRILPVTVGLMTLAAGVVGCALRSPALTGPLLTFGAAAGLLWYLKLLEGELSVELSPRAVRAAVVYGTSMLILGAVKSLHLDRVRPWMVLWGAVLAYAVPRWGRVPGYVRSVLSRSWRELVALILCLVLGALIADSPLPDVLRGYASAPPVAFAVGFVGELVMGSTTAVMATFSSGTPHPDLTLVGAACAAATCPYNVAVAAAAVRSHEKRIMRRGLLGTVYLSGVIVPWMLALWWIEGS